MLRCEAIPQRAFVPHELDFKGQGTTSGVDFVEMWMAGHGDIDVENVLFDGGVQMDLPDPDHPALVQSGPMFSAATLFPYHAQ